MVVPADPGKPVTACTLNGKAALVNKPVYGTLAAHQAAEVDWDYHELLLFLDEWYGRLNQRFRLNVPRVPLRLDHNLRRNCGGHFLPNHNEFGLAYEIAIAVPRPTHLASLDCGDLVGTLLHEQLHLLQELTGMPGHNSNYHNSQYRATAERFGLLVDYRGHQAYATESLFLELLAEHAVDPPRIVQIAQAIQRGEKPPIVLSKNKPPGRSTLRKWCGCTNVRVGVADFRARCTRPNCGNVYRLC